MNCKILAALHLLATALAVTAGEPSVSGNVLTIPNVTANQSWRLKLALKDDVQPTGGDEHVTTGDLDELSAEELKASAGVVAAEGVSAALMAKSSSADITLPTGISTYPIYPDADKTGSGDGYRRYAEMHWRLPLGDFNGTVLIYCTADMSKGSIDMISPYLAAGYAVLSLDMRTRAMPSKNSAFSGGSPFTPCQEDVTLENVLADFSAAMALAPAQATELGLAVSHWGMVGWEGNAWIALATMTGTEAGKRIEFANLIAPPVLPAATDKNGYGLMNGLDEAAIAAKADLRTTTVFHPAQHFYLYLRTTTDAAKTAENEALVTRLQNAGATVTRVDRDVSDTSYGYYEGAKFTTEPIAWMQDLGYGEEPEELTEISETYAATGAKLTVYIPKAVSGKRTALLLVAGGGYASVGTTGEGPDSCRLMARKFGLLTGAVVYRTTNGSPKSGSPLLDKPLEDATWAVRRMKQILKEKCGGFGAFGVMGFSAGGHLATTVATRWNEADALYATALSDVSSKPDFQVLFYPVVTMNAEFTHAGSRTALVGASPSDGDVRKYSSEYNVTETTPPACVTVARTDSMVPYRNSLVYVEALARKGVPVSYLEFEQGSKTYGGHGFADPGLAPYAKYGMTLGNSVYTGTQWNLAWQHVLRWMQSNGWLKLTFEDKTTPVWTLTGTSLVSSDGWTFTAAVSGSAVTVTPVSYSGSTGALDMRTMLVDAFPGVTTVKLAAAGADPVVKGGATFRETVTSVVFPEGAETVASESNGVGAFYNFTALTNAVVTQSVKSCPGALQKTLFASCKALENVDVHTSVLTSMNDWFQSCGGLRSVRWFGSYPDCFPSSLFWGCAKTPLTFYVIPNAGWEESPYVDLSTMSEKGYGTLYPGASGAYGPHRLEYLGGLETHDVTLKVTGSVDSNIVVSVLAGGTFRYDIAALVPADMTIVSQGVDKGVLSGTVVTLMDVTEDTTVTLALEYRPAGSVKPFKVASYFAHDMIVPCDRDFAVWGTAPSGQKVTVSFGDRTAEATSDNSGAWTATVAAVPANAVGRTLSVSAASGSLDCTNVVAGDVWMVAGQSNAELPIGSTAEYRNGILREINATPALRVWTVGFIASGVGSKTPLDDVPTDAKWARMCDVQGGKYTAIGAEFALQVWRATGRPQGVIMVAAGGSTITPFLPGEDKFNVIEAPLRRVPVRGVLWAQGEKDINWTTSAYHDAMVGLITGWRENWSNADLPFYVYQLTAFENTVDNVKKGNLDAYDGFYRIREIQRRVAGELPKVGLACTIDIGERYNIHPTNKWDVAERMARHALRGEYNADGRYDALAADGPSLKSVTPSGSRLRCAFDHAEGGLRLAVKDYTNVTFRTGVPVSQHFEVCGADGVWKAAVATVDGADVVLAADGVAAPVAARYCWKNWCEPVANLYNAAGLPMVPFVSNDDIDGGSAAGGGEQREMDVRVEAVDQSYLDFEATVTVEIR